MFVTGFIMGFVIMYLICAEETILPPYGNEGQFILIYGAVLKRPDISEENSVEPNLKCYTMFR
jgi:hypothetical protein